MKKTGIAIHGGAGTILRSMMTKEKEFHYKKSLEEALLEGWDLLKSSKSAVDAVERAVKILEDNPLFNAGKGSVFTNNETHEMDASIMDGRDLNAGCVSAVSNVKNPIILARKVMEKSEFVFLNGNGAEDFAKEMNLKFEDDAYFFDQKRFDQLLEAKSSDIIQLDHSEENNTKKFGTVGAVALDEYGNLAAATSTGGMTNKKYGRIGDSSLIGAGTYANNKTCAVSCTGHGEYFIKAVTAYDISALMEYKKISLEEACEYAVNVKLLSMKGEGGLIAIDNENNISMPFNSAGMYRAFIKNDLEAKISIYRNES